MSDTVLLSDKALDYFNELSFTLYEKGYFEFVETSEKYVRELITDIKTKLPYKLKRPAPEYFNKYGDKLLYAVFTKNKRTQWYVFFNIFQSSDGNNLIYLVEYITNNHVNAKRMP